MSSRCSLQARASIGLIFGTFFAAGAPGTYLSSNPLGQCRHQ
ncbi:hypothetical protein S1OALGB6SA_707 [Olavius algarvensis spirochete endosymbiont]|nr:hypothetical protein S1OALGB6SA_707 [Olavius algarvensis spirochete endosymbiont]